MNWDDLKKCPSCLGLEKKMVSCLKCNGVGMVTKHDKPIPGSIAPVVKAKKVKERTNVKGRRY